MNFNMAKKKTVKKKVPNPNRKQKGAKHIPINWDEVDVSLISGSSGVEIAAMLGCHKDTLYDRCQEEKGMAFSLYSAYLRQKGDTLLRKAQFKNAMQGNTTMQIWLGKVRLKQTEYQPDSKTPANDEKLDTLFNLIKKAKDD